MFRKKILALIPGTCIAFSGVAGAATGLPWTSDFENGGIGEWNADRNGTVTITDRDAYSGRYSARVDLRANTLNDNFLGHHFGDFVTERGDKVEEVWLSMRSKFNSGYQFPGRESHKIAIFNLTDGQSWSRRYQVYLWVDSRGEYKVDKSNISNWRFDVLSQNRGTPARVRYDQWDKLKLYVKLNRPGRADGIVRLWVNNELKLEHTNLDIREGTSYGINKLILSSYTSGENGGNGTQWYDNWVLSETDPDANDSPPSAPVLRVSR